MPHNSLNKNVLDVAQIFQTYIVFGGDIERTAYAMRLDNQIIRDLANAEHWRDKIAQWNELKEGDLRDVRFEINRGLNYVQAQRLRSILDKVISHLYTMDGAEIVRFLTKQGKDSSEFSARPLTDLVKAAETCQIMTQRALGDTAAERPEVKCSKGSDVALRVMKAMEAADSAGLDSVEIIRSELRGRPSPADN